MKALSPSRERQRKKADEAREIVTRLSDRAVTLSTKELAFVMSVGRKLKRADYVSGKQLAWLRALQLKNWGVSELDRAIGDDVP
jgi:hypothetical protein